MPAPGKRADLIRLDAPSHIHLAYCPGVPLLGDVVIGGSWEIAEAVLSLIQGTFVLALSTRDKHTPASLVTTLRLLVEPPA